MKILVVSDIHANWPALQAIEESFDACLFLGDLVDYGTDPLPCIDWVQKNATLAVRGNHDHAVAQRVAVRGGSPFRRLTAATRQAQYNAITPDKMRYLSRLPVTASQTIDGLKFHLVHATPRDPLDEYLYEDPEGWSARLKHVDADFVCVGHTHQQFHIKLDGVEILNPGSVGQPRDGDPRAAYAVIENGKVELRRVAYDIDASLEQMRSAGVESWVLQMAEAVLRTGGRSRGEHPE
ncbi:metallophosphoesterase family protein [Symmachiella dynata]|jgi:putative phosphoesterase|uniref:Phosphoesterase n=1 Tax=Symmachiella dynata TaxID=2527995 RepID=A0A517ZTB3_9PLAN|nr:YfcE family phosphodiesterase [Symmachiella dynata]QDT49983.1 phosphodiesterase [Symmachiella dynata]QDU45700.1 phosphodiesterase [Symmachiella dynata]